MKDEMRDRGSGAGGRSESAASDAELPISAPKSLPPDSRPPAPDSRPPAWWIERALTASLFLLAACAPHTIAGTQGAWGLALLLWIARIVVRGPGRVLRRTPLDYWLLGFVCLTFISALFSYEPLVSVAKMRAVSLFTIVYLVAENVASARRLRGGDARRPRPPAQPDRPAHGRVGHPW
jgi:hypothetical protein